MPGGRGGSDGGGSSGASGSSGSGGTDGGEGGLGQGGVGVGGAGGDPPVSGAGGVGGDPGAGGAGGTIDPGGAGGTIDPGGAGGTIDPGGAGGSGGGGSSNCLADNTTLNVDASQATTNYVIEGQSDPTLTLCRGYTYHFAVNVGIHVFWIKSVSSIGTANAYSDGVTNNGESLGTIDFTVPVGAPDTLFYNCELHLTMSGTLQIVD